ncbi:DMT family transporter [Pseudomonadota bacterium]
MSDRRLQDLFPIISLLIAATVWGVMWYPLRLLNEAGLNGVWTSLIAYSTLLVPALPFLWRGRQELREQILPLLAIGIATGWCNLAFVLAVLDGTVVRVLILFYLSPLWAVLLGHFILGERMTLYSRLVLLAAMFGALMMLWSPELGFPWPQSASDWLAISSGFSFALANVFVRKNQQISMTNKILSTWWGGVLIAAFCVLFVSGNGVPDFNWGVILGAMLLGLFGMGVATVTIQYGVTHMPVHRSAVILLFELIIGAVSAQLLTDESVRMIEWLGGGLILTAAWLTARRQAGA